MGLTTNQQGFPHDECGLDPYGGLKDSRDGQVYRTVRIGKQNWMAENLAYMPADGHGAWAQEGGTDSTEKYGLHYSWTTAMKLDDVWAHRAWPGSDSLHQGICPDGWHLPNYAEWEELALFVERVADLSQKTLTPLPDSVNTGSLLKARNAWGEGYKGLDSHGFRALPSGHRYDSTYAVGSSAYFWTSHTSNDTLSIERQLLSYALEGFYYRNAEELYWYSEPRTTGNSVRCVMNAAQDSL